MTDFEWRDDGSTWRLFVVSVTGLYAELMLIRWIGTEIRVFAFFQNLGLIACFLGFGLGCYRSKVHIDLSASLKALTILAVIVSIPLRPWKVLLFGISDLLAMSPDATLWAAGIELFGTDRIGGLVLACASMSLFILLLTIVMIPFGQLVARYMNSAPNVIRAYSINLVGSIIGIWLMAGISFLRMPPTVWFSILFVLSLLCIPIQKKFIVTVCVLIAVSVTFLHLGTRTSGETLWSPYQKLTVSEARDTNYQIEVNNSNYMTIANATPEYLSRHPEVATDIQNSSYDSPFRFAVSKDRVLVVGSGAGNDIAAALRNGAGRVDAVEIDPTIQSIGARLHPEHPYQSPKVRIIINDARNFLRTQKEKYDVIVFGLLDSHTGFSSYSNMRIDNYVYTIESFRSARELLKPGGILVLKFEVPPRWTWLGSRFYAMLSGLFDHAPITYFAPQVGPLLSASVFIESNSADLWTRAQNPDLNSLISNNPVGYPILPVSQAPPPTSDNWPYVYHRSRTMPRTYLTVTIILLVLSFLSVRRVFDARRSSTWLFFLLGAGFLLLETQLINRLALYFGSTWLVNCVAISLLLAVLVFSNFCIERGWGERVTAFYVPLVVALLSIYFLPFEQLPLDPRLIGLLLCACFAIPVFAAGIVFSRAFRASESKATALGSNVFGAVAGGLLQNLSFIFGLKALLLIAAMLYLVAGLLHHHQKRSVEPDVELVESAKI